MLPNAANTLDASIKLTNFAAGNLEQRSWTTTWCLDDSIGPNNLAATVSQHFEETL